MTFPEGWPKCETCAEPATQMVRDVRDVTEPGDAWVRYAPEGPPRVGCDAHPPGAAMVHTRYGVEPLG